MQKSFVGRTLIVQKKKYPADRRVWARYLENPILLKILEAVVTARSEQLLTNTWDSL